MKMRNYIQRIILIASMRCFFFVNSPAQELTLLFAGDAMQHQVQIDNAWRDGKYDYSSYFKYLQSEIKKADLAIVNLEVTLGGSPYKGYPQFSAPDEFAIALKEAGFGIFLTANNHILDRGKKGLERTTRILDSLQVLHTGSFIDLQEKEKNYPLIITKNGIRIAFLNYTYATNGFTVSAPNVVNYIDKKLIRKDIETAKKQNPDIIIANMHWGLEYKLIQNAEQENLAKFLIDNGVNIVMGSHPHVIQPSKVARDENGNISNLIVYSMGNFVSGMKAVNTDGGQLIRITLQKNILKTQIKSCSYSLVYVDKRKNGNKTDFMLIPVEQAEDRKDIFFYKPQIALDTVACQRMKIFTQNARSIFSKYNQGIEEYQPSKANFWENILIFSFENLPNAN